MQDVYRDYSYTSESPRQQTRPTPSPRSPEVYQGYRYGLVEEVDSGINAYDEEEEEEADEDGLNGARKQALLGMSYNEVYGKDAYSPYSGGMDFRLAQFVNQHNVNMDDGAIIYPLSREEKNVTNKYKWVRL